MLPLQRHQLATDVLASPGILAYRFEANLFYANANRFTQELMAITSQPDAVIRGLVVDASGIDDIDYSAAKALLELRDHLRQSGIEFALVTSSTAMLKELHRFGMGIGTGDNSVGIFATVKQAIHALYAHLCPMTSPSAMPVMAAFALRPASSITLWSCSIETSR
ncbi:sodium-independent anion transporter [Synechococcus sp. CBW1006]|uniref:sodium-independent anion transporter n=1 Tax=Synechococcus sp. CBW1006 TaxID=1353138 RepID=UPI001E3F61B6|nr:sodium-independent anion transporter [Synechococcus sp. CBW1006]